MKYDKYLINFFVGYAKVAFSLRDDAWILPFEGATFYYSYSTGNPNFLHGLREPSYYDSLWNLKFVLKHKSLFRLPIKNYG